MRNEADDVKAELDDMRAQLDEMADDVAAAEAGMAELARHDMQVSDLRAQLDEARRRHAALDEREKALRSRFQTIMGDTPDRTH